RLGQGSWPQRTKGSAMDETDIEDRPDLNSGTPWSGMAFFDLANCVRGGTPIEEIASFLCRSRGEGRQKIGQVERSGELARRIEGTVASALPESRPAQ